MKSAFDQEKKEEIIKLIEFALEPIGGKDEKFKDSFEIRHMSRQGNEPEHRWVEQLYPISIKTKFGKLEPCLSSMHINSVWDMVFVACRDLAYLHNTPMEVQNEIVKKLYSDEFMALKNNK